jgi:2-polyprenyl-6-methoxyphenol hydroxylase-like FAD-dependent oxidoreductase
VRIVVVGGGIGGLSAAIALRRAGNEVVLLERAPRIDQVGAGITLFANAMRALDRLGVREAVAAQGAAAKRSAILTWDGRELTRIPWTCSRGRSRSIAPICKPSSQPPVAGCVSASRSRLSSSMTMVSSP